jgi:hypothetical protein
MRNKKVFGEATAKFFASLCETSPIHPRLIPFDSITTFAGKSLCFILMPGRGKRFMPVTR